MSLICCALGIATFSTVTRAADPVELFWSASASIVADPLQSGMPGGQDQKAGAGFITGVTSSLVSINAAYQSNAESRITISSPTLTNISGAPEPMWVESFAIHQLTGSTAEQNCNVGASATFTLNEPVLTVIPVLETFGRYFPGYASMSGPAGFNVADYKGYPGSYSAFKLLPPGTYTMSVGGGGKAAGHTNNIENDGQIYFIAPEPTSCATLLLTLPPFLVLRRRR